MTQATLVQLITQLETLELDELQKLSQAIPVRLNALDEPTRLTQLYSSLVDSGLVCYVRQGSLKQQPRLSLVSVQGSSLSETILEERR
ncbi:hypothetical protein VB712_00850 [Spirulina sp. CCNP1310]|uniref:hypothetical protein n=1 Tax=Spirulina sp. CCNP1310 TaxID=3110249 RepID=UPI002B2005F2|nr:hypothetical protein [Spirulina sp. CCNP1310]MEA5417750.1 hypothetical protein [Spirulina sp. CCNP1310]